MMGIPTYTSDTSVESAALHLQCFRRMTPAMRLQKACTASQRAKRMAFAAIRRRHPLMSPGEIQVKYLEIAYGRDISIAVQRWQQERRA